LLSNAQSNTAMSSKGNWTRCKDEVSLFCTSAQESTPRPEKAFSTHCKSSGTHWKASGTHWKASSTHWKGS
jgi:hypothetical protein